MHELAASFARGFSWTGINHIIIIITSIIIFIILVIMIIHERTGGGKHKKWGARGVACGSMGFFD